MNPKFSLRAFAKFLDIDPAALSRILNGKYVLSTSLARVILHRIPMSRKDALAFVESVADSKRQQTIDSLRPDIPKRIYSGGEN